MSDELTVVGKYDGIEEKQSGWFEVKVNVPGKKYPYRLATKRSTILDAVRETRGEIATFTYTEKESDRINENTQKPYVNRYLEGVVLGGDPAGNGTATAGGSERMTKEEWNAKDRRDYRSRSWAQTISAFAHTVTVEEKPVDVFARLKPFQRKLYEDIVGDLEPAAAQPVAQQSTGEPASGGGDYDDDIPFAPAIF